MRPICDGQAMNLKEDAQVKMNNPEVMTVALTASMYFTGNYETSREFLMEHQYISNMFFWLRVYENSKQVATLNPQKCTKDSWMDSQFLSSGTFFAIRPIVKDLVPRAFRIATSIVQHVATREPIPYLRIRFPVLT